MGGYFYGTEIFAPDKTCQLQAKVNSIVWFLKVVIHHTVCKGNIEEDALLPSSYLSLLSAEIVTMSPLLSISLGLSTLCIAGTCSPVRTR
jgi:hypothetical protein